ncbi:hypothetical protein HMPREF1624_06429 [Sporothrix schenckii ATCC 58251]|uniref:Zn(2)-C6 fungal-type domain-containing protein n=1 Tax=Sporothrix schenckii (strain ATCC 58251 / de Perez 2211183) TaxID=1391915 RepID=U7PRK6_SPOS1|nr:hypothetical protein HMPREF1624_06429 [Sporothrix schenckii ATCC 58251]
MEQIETQATDLRYLMQAVPPPPLPAPAQAQAHSHQQHQHHHPHPHPQSHPSLPHPGPYPRMPSADDHARHAALSPHHLNRSVSSSSPLAAAGANSRPPPPQILHDPSNSGPAFGGASTPLPSPFSPDAGAQNSYYSNTAGNGNVANNGASNSGPGSSSNVNNASNRGSPGSVAGGNSGTPSGKRKHDDEETTAKQQRSKRNRYISIACNECKRRKIKCNGETPCLRCGNLNLACLYSPNCCSSSFKDSEEFKSMTEKIHNLEDQLESIVQSIHALRQETQRVTPHQDRILPIPSSTVSPSPSSSVPSLHKPELAPIRQPHTFRGGPTSMAFTVDVAKNTLHNMGYSGEPQEEGGNGPAVEETPRTSPFLPPVSIQTSSSMLPLSSRNQVPNDPLWEFDKDEMVRLCRLHEDEVGIMYPVVKIETVIEHAQSLSSWMESARRSGYMPPLHYDETMTDIRTLTLKVIMCCGLAVEEHGHSAKAIRLYDSMQSITDGKLMSEPSNLANLPFLALVAGYRFLSNDEVLAWRVMGQVARHCLEQGLHRREGIVKIADEQERRDAINTFWTAYVLDRRWSFGTGLPYVLHDDKIDPNLPFPDEYPYLVAMITYSRLGAKIWSLVDFFEPAIIRDLKREEFETLDREILQWYDSCPDAVKISNFDRELPLPSTPSYNLQRLQIWTRLRLNQIRIWLNTPVLHSASSINDNMEQAQKVVDLAKDTIRYLSRLNNSSNLYRRIQVFYHQFLTSAIAVLFLASTHQPVQFSADCREEFYMAMNLVKDMSAKSWVSQRLWRTIRSLTAYAPRLGLGLQQNDEDSQYSFATKMSGFNVGNGGLASGSVTASASAAVSAPGRDGSIASSTGSGYPNSNSSNGPNQSQKAHPPLAHPSSKSGNTGNTGNNGNSSNTASPSTTAAGAVANGPPLTPSTGMAPGAQPQPLEQKQQQQQQQQSQTTKPGQQPTTATTTSATAGASATSSPEQETANGVQIQTEMTRIYEGFLGLSGIPAPAAGTVTDSTKGGVAAAEAAAGTPTSNANVEPKLAAEGLPSGEAVYEHLKNMF